MAFKPTNIFIRTISCEWYFFATSKDQHLNIWTLRHTNHSKEEKSAETVVEKDHESPSLLQHTCAYVQYKESMCTQDSRGRLPIILDGPSSGNKQSNSHTPQQQHTKTHPMHPYIRAPADQHTRTHACAQTFSEDSFQLAMQTSNIHINTQPYYHEVSRKHSACDASVNRMQLTSKHTDNDSQVRKGGREAEKEEERN